MELLLNGRALMLTAESLVVVTALWLLVAHIAERVRPDLDPYGYHHREELRAAIWAKLAALDQDANPLRAASLRGYLAHLRRVDETMQQLEREADA